MKTKIGIFGKLISALLAMVMVFTCIAVGFVPGLFSDIFGIKAEASMTQTAASQPEVFIVVPETIYLSPDLTLATKAQYYVNNTFNNSTNAVALDTVRDATTGKYYFKCNSATSLSVKMNGISAGTLKDSTSVALSGGYGSGTISEATLSEGLAQKETSTVEWEFTYTLSNGATMTSYAYTTCYAPYCQPVGAAIRTKDTNRGEVFSQQVSWWSGVHAVGARPSEMETGGQGLKNNDPYYPNAAKLSPMTNTPDIPTSHSAVTSWLSSSSNGGMTEQSIYYANYEADGNGSWITTNGTGFTALLTVDTSRYTNLSLVPNVTANMLVTDLEHADKRQVYKVWNYTGRCYNNAYKSDDNHDIMNSDTSASLVTTGTPTLGFRYNSAFNYAFAANSTGNSSFTLKILSECANEDGAFDYSDAWACAVAYCPITITKVDKSSLRSRVKATISENYQQSWYTASTWDAYKTALTNACKVLGNPTATAAQATSVQTTLENAVFALSRASYTVTLTHTLPAAAGFSYNYGGTTYTSNGSAMVITETLNVTAGNHVVCASNDYAGYTNPNTTETLYHISSDTTHNINYAAIKSRLSLEANGGIIMDAGNPQGSITNDVTFGQKYGALNVPTRLGYSLSGWATTAEGGTAVSENTYCIVINSNTITKIYAQWTPDTYSVGYNLNGGAWAAGGNTGTSTYTINTTSTATVAQPEKTGYSFAGWTVSADSGSWTAGTAFDNGTVLFNNYGNIVLNANWTPVNYDISYNYTGGAASNPTTYNIETTFTLTNPTRAGYSFAYWTSTSDGITAADNNQAVRVNETLNQTGTKDYTANWNLVDYTGLVFNAGAGQVNIGGSAVGSVYTVPSYNIASRVTIPQALRDYYTLQRWDVTVASGNWETGTHFTPGNEVTGKYGNATLSAVWQADSYSIEYDLAGGSATGTNPTAYNVENASFTLSNPTREGYTFAGWTGTGLSGAVINVTIDAGSHGNRSYVATWTLDTYTLSYNNNVAALVNIPGYSTLTPGENPSQYNYEAADIEIENPSFTAYTFAGWTGTGLTSATTTLFILNHSTGNKSFVANWTPTTYTYALNPNGGSIAGQTGTVNSTYNVISTASLPLPVRNGYTFMGWKPVESSGNWDADTLYADGTVLGGSFGAVNLVAQWSASSYTITLDTDGGTLSSGTGALPYMITSSTALPTASKTGYTFGGWRATTVSGSWVSGTEYHASVPMGQYGNVTLKAIWNATAYNASFVTSGSAVSNITGYTIESGIILPVTSKENYVFTGWKPNTSVGNWSSAEIYAAENYSGKYGTVSFTAQWTAVQYTLVLNGNGVASPANISYNIEDHVSLPVLTRNGYTFGGWRVTGAAGNWANNEYYSAGSDLVSKYGNATLTAQWTPVTYTVFYEENGGGELSNTNYTAENTTAVFATPVRTGYTFLYWSVNENAGSWTAGTHYNAGAIIPSGMYANVALTAVWEINHYTITWIDGDGNTLDTDTVDHGNMPSYTGATPTKSATAQYSYSFTGWSPAVTAATGNQTYTAQFSSTVRSYTVEWYNGVTLLDSETYEYGKIPTYKGALPTQINSYMTGWSPAVSAVTGNATYTAQFTPASGTTYSVTWNIDGTAYTETYSAGVVPVYGGGTPYKTPDTYSSYIFSGWSNTQGGTVLTALPAVASNVTYYAVFTSQYTQYEIDFITAGGDSIGALSYNFGSTDTLPVPVKNGYTFTGWTVSTASGNWTNGAALGTAYALNHNYGDIALTAGWTPTAYTLTLVYADGVTANGSLSYNIESAASVVLPSATRNGYLFSGWKVTTAAGSWTAGAEFGANTLLAGNFGNAVLTAVWTARSYTLFLDGNNGAIAGDITSVTYKIDEQLVLPSVSRTGYDFTGWLVTVEAGNWFEADTPYPSDEYIIGKYGNATLTAQWTPTVYTATLVPNGGSVEGGDESVEYTMFGTAYLPVITREGYTFTGWLVTSTSEGSWTFGESVAAQAALYGRNGNVTLNAQWQVNTYTVTWVANGVSSVDSYEYGSLVTARTLAMRNGYNGVWDITVPTTMPAEDLIVTAIYELIDYSIVFNTSGAAPIATLTYNIESTDALPVPTLDGHTFEGWRVTSAAGNWMMNEITEIGMLLTGRYGTVRLTAQWSVSTHEITWVVGTNERIAVWYYGAMPSFDGTPSLASTQSSNYVFAGWSLTENGALLDEIPSVTGDARYYAVFTSTVRSYNVNWNVDGVLITETYDYGTVPSYNFAIYGTPTREATEIYTYEFAGWTPGITAVSGEKTYYATFNASAHAQSVSLNIPDAVLDLNESASLSATVNPVEALDRSVTWSSSNPSVAMVSPDGTVIPTGVGVAVITVTTVENSHTASCVVRVEPIYTSYVKIFTGGAVCSGKSGDTIQLSTEVLPYNATQLGIVWSSTNTTVATVTQNGLVEIVGVGTAEIKAVTADGRCAASVEITGLPEDEVVVEKTHTVIYSALLGGSYIVNGIPVTESKYVKYTEGSNVTFTLNVDTAEDESYYVTANGIKVYPNSEGVYTITNLSTDVTIMVMLYDIGIEDPENPNPNPDPENGGGLSGFFNSLKAFFAKIAEFFRNLFN